MPAKKVNEPLRWTVEQYTNLYQSSRYLSNDVRRTLGLLIPVEVYLQDPSVSEQARLDPDPRISARAEWDPIRAIDIPCEPDLGRGPTSARISVIDFDPQTGRREDPAEWDPDLRRFYALRKREKIYLSREHADLPQFHQVNVWAVVQSVLGMYEQETILGRPLAWAFEGNRLRLRPHVGGMENAMYDRDSRSISFGAFERAGKRVFTCLSHDLIAHETGHAVLDGLRPYFSADTSIQTAAFHEFAADLTAILAAFLNNELRFQALKESAGDMQHDQIISGLAEEFGYYSHGRPYLRSAQDGRGTADVIDNPDPYAWSQVLTGAMFDILKEMLSIRKVKLIASGRQPTLKEAFSLACNRFRRAAFQPFDYLPPVDVQFGDYARAVLRADEIVDPRDDDGYRAAMRGVFARRGIDCAPQESSERLNFYAYDIERLSRSRTDAYLFLNENRRQLCIPADQDFNVVDLYQTDKLAWGAGRLAREIVVQYVWREDVELEGREFGIAQGRRVPLWCGGTLVFDERGNILSWQHKPGMGKQEGGARRRAYSEAVRARGAERRDQLLAYQRAKLSAGPQV